MTKDTSKKVILMGWDGADWQIIQQLLDDGHMPNLQKLVERGVIGNIATMKPVLSPILWTTIATGKTAEDHGIYGFLEPRPDGGGVRPVTSTSIRIPTIWEIVEDAGLKSALVSWFASYPADRFPGLVVSDMVPNASGQSIEDWPFPPRGVSPPEFESVIRDLRVHPSEFDADAILPFVPKAAEVDQKTDERLGAIARFLARCATVHASATHIAENEDWNLLAVYYETIDRMCHFFMECMPPRMKHVPERDVEIYQHVVHGMYRFHDMMLGRYLDIIDDDTTIVICSDHGFYSGDQRPPVSSNMKTGNPVAWHRQYGIFLASGPGIKKDELIYGASILDIAPTILALLGLPVGRDMEGRVLSQIFETPLATAYVDKYDRPPAPVEVDTDEGDPWGAQESIAQLVALGYISPPSQDAEKAIHDTTIQRYSNLAQTFIHKRRYRRAIQVLREWQKLTPRNVQIRIMLGRCLLAINKLDEAAKELEELLDVRSKNPFAHALYGEYWLKKGDDERALEHFQKALTGGHNSTNLLNRVAMVLLRRRRFEESIETFNQALERDPDNATSYDGLGSALFAKGEHEESIAYHMHSISLWYQNPYAHFHLGLSLAATGRLEQAVEALANALKLKPDLADAHALLDLIKDRAGADIARKAVETYEQSQADALQFDEPESTADDLIPEFSSNTAIGESPTLAPINNEVVIVTGLPRSGTSMMMQMLSAGGLETLSDANRVADESNPKGYFEHEGVKALEQHPELLEQAAGKSIKIIHALLRHLPGSFAYRVVFMRRRMEEVLASQTAMIQHAGTAGARADDESLAQVYSRQLMDAQSLLSKLPDCAVLYVDYNETVTDPTTTAWRVNRFLGGRLDEPKMVECVDQNLYRQRG